MTTQSTEIIHFTTDGLRLTGTLHRPTGVRRPPIVVGCHGLLADRQSNKQIALAASATEAGIAYFRIDHRGCGDSQGDRNTDTSHAARCRDLHAAIDTLAVRTDLSDRIGLFGSSMGGAVCLGVAAQRRIGAVATVAAPVRLPLTDSTGAKSEPVLPDGFVRENLRFDLSDHLRTVSRVLVLHGDSDETVPVDHADIIYHTVSTPKHQIIIPGGDHRISRPDHRRALICHAMGWFRRHLITPDDAARR